MPRNLRKIEYTIITSVLSRNFVLNGLKIATVTSAFYYFFTADSNFLRSVPEMQIEMLLIKINVTRQ